MKPYYIAEAVIFLLAVLFFAIVFLLPVWVVTLVFPTKSVYVVCIGGFLAIAAAARLSLLGSRLSGGSQAFKKLQAESRNRGPVYEQAKRKLSISLVDAIRNGVRRQL